MSLWCIEIINKMEVRNMTQNSEKLMIMVETNEEFRNKFLECKESEEVKKLALEYDLELNDEDLDFSVDKEEIDAEELEAVAGGKACVCVMGGGGEANRKGQKTCACVGAGFGYVEFSCKFPSLSGSGTGHDDYMRCMCIAGGGGKDHDFDDATRVWNEEYWKNR